MVADDDKGWVFPPTLLTVHNPATAHTSIVFKVKAYYAAEVGPGEFGNSAFGPAPFKLFLLCFQFLSYSTNRALSDLNKTTICMMHTSCKRRFCVPRPRPLPPGVRQAQRRGAGRSI